MLRAIAVIVILAVGAALVPAQQRLDFEAFFKKKDYSPMGEFTFARAIYYSPYPGWRSGMWTVDFPEADYHFMAGIKEWAGTNLTITPQPQQIQFLDDRIFKYPMLYIVEPGFMEITDDEAARIREYTARGGFVFLDDFWGEIEWRHVQETLQRIFPNHQVKDLPPDHPLLHSYFDINEIVQVPGIGSWLSRGVTHEKGGFIPHYMGVEDEKGRIVAFMSRNCDLGDAWEWINDPRYPVKYGLAAYRIGINVVIYSMSH